MSNQAPKLDGMDDKDRMQPLIRHLNKILLNELTAINQYFLHARMMQHQGFEKLGAYEYEESIDEMKHADQLTKRILFLGGLPNLQNLGTLNIGENVEEMLRSDLDMEIEAIADLKEAISYADHINEYAVVDELGGILASEEQHYDWLQKQLRLINSLGIQNYLQTAAV